MVMSRRRARAGEIDDTELAGFLAGEALVEIRILAIRARQHPDDLPPGVAADKISDWADFSRDMLGVSRSRRRRPSRGTPRMREQAMSERPMSYRWNTCGPERRAWIMGRIDRAGLRWTPPLPTPSKGVPALTVRQRVSLPAGWPVKTPPGRQPLPHVARVLKALDREALVAFYQERGQETHGAWLRAHLDPDATLPFPGPG
jgi:hypothetical protein